VAIQKITPHTLEVEGYTIYYDNHASAEQTIDEIFYQSAYAFNAKTKRPRIIDAGSNIGIATLFFKKHYPKANILCFEPDPISFAMLQKNVAINGLKNVTLFNAALSDTQGKLKFYGQVSVENPDTRGNSLLPAWGLQRSTSDSIEVDAVCLHNYINSPIDLLKLDIEGAEQKVLESLKDKLGWVREIVLEFHEADVMKQENNLEATLALLQQHQFTITVLKKNHVCLPDSIKTWVNATQPILYHIKAVRS